MENTNKLEEAIKTFKEKKEKENQYASQIATIQLLFQLDVLDPKTLSQESYESIVKRVEKALRAERIKGIQKHWGYDLNRHISLRRIRDQLISEKTSSKRKYYS